MAFVLKFAVPTGISLRLLVLSGIGLGWQGCVNFPPPLELFDFDFGEPAELCHETLPGSGIFTRRWTRAHISVDCNNNTAQIIVDGHLIPPLPPPPPPAPAPPLPPSPPSPPCCPKCSGPCRQCPDVKQKCPFPVPPLPPCPASFENHSSGFWANPDQKHGIAGVSVPACGTLCEAKQGCVGFEVYDPEYVTAPPQGKGSSCFTYSKLAPPFTYDKRGLIRTCTRAKSDTEMT